MRKKYLNKADKLAVSIFGSFAAYLDSYAECYKDTPKAKTAVKYARMAKAFALKVTDEYFADLDMDQRKKVIADVAKLHVITKYTDEAVREYGTMQALDANTVLPNDDYYDLVEAVLEATCKGCSREPGECKVKRIFVVHDVEPYDCETEGCPYRH